ncbi:hypothetical protein [Candidatus Ichthyocystis hellenicum]|uniref:hypothetical protein n=1 Tax=Candidatus Ichthyocystis hellenicum TaxID=1561003 RepID=UPI001111910F|nr:hypothetical protein [Candidatus Ichthyocystis hellenicum]
MSRMSVIAEHKLCYSNPSLCHSSDNEESQTLLSLHSRDNIYELCEVICEVPPNITTSSNKTNISSLRSIVPMACGNRSIIASSSNKEPRPGSTISRIFLTLSFSYVTLSTVLALIDRDALVVYSLSFLGIGTICFILGISGYTCGPISRLFHRLESKEDKSSESTKSS